MAPSELWTNCRIFAAVCQNYVGQLHLLDLPTFLTTTLLEITQAYKLFYDYCVHNIVSNVTKNTIEKLTYLALEAN